MRQLRANQSSQHSTPRRSERVARRAAARAPAPRTRPVRVAITRVERVTVLEIDDLYGRIWAVLASRKMSMRMLALRVGVDRRLLERMLQSERLTERTLGRLEAALGVDRAYWSLTSRSLPAGGHKSRAWDALDRPAKRVSGRASKVF